VSDNNDFDNAKLYADAYTNSTMPASLAIGTHVTDQPEDWFPQTDGSNEVGDRVQSFRVLQLYPPMRSDRMGAFIAIHEPKIVQAMWAVICAAEDWSQYDEGESGEQEAEKGIVEALEELRPLMEKKMAQVKEWGVPAPKR